MKTHGKGREKNLVRLGAHGTPFGANGGNGSWAHGKLKGLPCVLKNARQTIVYRVFFLCRASYIKLTAKYLFAVHPTENTRQRFSRTAKVSFPVVLGLTTGCKTWFGMGVLY
jgi:hypothetical protein